jgi:amidase
MGERLAGHPERTRRVDVGEYGRVDAVGLRDLIRRGAVSAAEVQAAARVALEIADAELNGLALPVFPAALAHAADGPLAGVPFLLKDSGPVAEGVPFSCGSRALTALRAARDSDLMTRVRAAGLVTVGLTTVPEMWLSYATESVKHGPTRNPWDPDRGVGGSSGGAAALVAAGAVPLAHGNDGAGSIRIPASCCGLVGLKPSRGRTPSAAGQGAAGFGLSVEFGLSRTVRDTAHYLDAVHGSSVGDRYTPPGPRRRYAQELTANPGRLRVAVHTRSWSGGGVDAEVADATLLAGRVLEQLGHVGTEDGPVIEGDAVVQSLRAEAAAAAAPLLTAARPPDPARLEAMTRQVLAEVRQCTAVQLITALDAHQQIARSVGRFFTGYDLLLTPTLARLPAPHGTLDYDAEGQTVSDWFRTLLDYGPFTAVFNIAGQPAISLPLAQSRTGLPIGVQLVARYGREDLLLRVASQLEQALPWRDRTPPSSVTRSGCLTLP